MGYEYNIVSFPGLGIGEMRLREVAFSIFGVQVAWYAVIIAFGMLMAYLYMHFYSRKKEGISENDFADYFLITIPLGVIGARLYYIIFHFETVTRSDNPFLAIFNIRGGGLAIYGGILVGILMIYLISRHKKISPLSAFDMAAPAVILAQGIGRFGNFVNGEAHGGITDSYLRMGLTKVSKGGYERFIGYVHPTFLYESLWNFVGFAIIQFLYRKKRYNGQIFFFYIAWYGIGRFFIELLRTDSLYLGPIRISSLVGILCFAIGVAGSIYYELKRKEKQDGNKH